VLFTIIVNKGVSQSSTLPNTQLRHLICPLKRKSAKNRFVALLLHCCGNLIFQVHGQARKNKINKNKEGLANLFVLTVLAFVLLTGIIIIVTFCHAHGNRVSNYRNTSLFCNCTPVG